MRGLTTGLTTASTLFVVAAVGMAAGGGLYLTAIFAAGLILLALLFLGHAEQTFNLKLLIFGYEVTGVSVEDMSNEINRILESHHRMMQNTLTGNTGQYIRLRFDVEGCNREQKELLQQLKASKVLLGATSLGPVDIE